MAKKRVKSAVVRIYNKSRQMIPLQIRAPGGDFYASEQQVRLRPGKDALLPKSHLMMDQILNLQQKRMIRVIYDSETETS